MGSFAVPDTPPESPASAPADGIMPEPPALDLSEETSTMSRQNTSPELKQEEQQERSSAPSPEVASEPSPAPALFTFNREANRQTWYRQPVDDQSYVQICVERPGFPDGAIICDRIDPGVLFKWVPSLRKQLVGRRIFIPLAPSLDEDVVSWVVHELPNEGAVTEEMKKDPVTLLKIHCVLVYFKMNKKAEELKDFLWGLFSRVDLTPEHVIWIWDTFSGRIPAEYTPPFAEEYVQMMAWRILVLDGEKQLHKDIRFMLEKEKEPKVLYEVMKKRFLTHGHQKDPLNTGASNEASAAAHTTASAPESMAQPGLVPTHDQTNGSKPSPTGRVDEHPKGNVEVANTTVAGQQQPPSSEAASNPSIVQTLLDAPSQGNLTPAPASLGFSFTPAGTTDRRDPNAAPPAVAKTGTKRAASSDDDDTAVQKRVMTGFNPSIPAGSSSSLGFSGTGTLKPTAPTPSTTVPPAVAAPTLGCLGAGTSNPVAAPSKPFNLFNQSAIQPATGTTPSKPSVNLFGPATKPATPPATTTVTTADFPWGGTAPTKSSRRKPAATTTTATGFTWSTPAAPPPPTSAAPRSNNVFGDTVESKTNSFAQGVSTSNQFGSGFAKPSAPQNGGLFGSIKTPAAGQAAVQNTPFGFENSSSPMVPNSGASNSTFANPSNNNGMFGAQPTGVNVFGTRPNTSNAFGSQPNNPATFDARPNTATAFGAQPAAAFGAQSNTPGAFGAPSNTPGAFGVQSNPFTSPALPRPAATPTVFSPDVNVNFGDQSQPAGGSLFPNANFGGAANDTGNFGFISTPGGNSTARGATGGGLGRLTKKATGTRGRKR